MGQELKHQLNADLAKAKFYSGLCDGSMDTTTVENEVNNIVVCFLFNTRWITKTKISNTESKIVHYLPNLTSKALNYKNFPADI